MDLPSGVEIDVVMNNPLFNDDNLSPGSGSYPFQIPGDDHSEKNSRLLGNPDALEQPSGGFRKFESDLYIDGNDFKKGKIIVREAQAGNINVNFMFGLAKVSDEFKTKKIRDLADIPVTISTTPITKKIFVKPGAAAEAPYRIEVNGKPYESGPDWNSSAIYNSNGSGAGRYCKHTGTNGKKRVFESKTNGNANNEPPTDPNEDENTFWKKVDLAGALDALAIQINANTEKPAATATRITTGTTPSGISAPFIEITPTENPNDPLSRLHVKPVDDNGNGTSGFIWLADTFDMSVYYSEFQNFVNENTGAIYGWPLCFNRDIYGENPFFQFNPGAPAGALAGGTKDYPYVNAVADIGGPPPDPDTIAPLIFNQSNFGVGVNVPFLVRNSNSLQPFVRLGWLLDQILDYFNLEMEGDWRDADVENMFIDNASPLDDPQDFLGSKKFVFWRRSFNVRQLLPDLTVVEFLRALQKRYNLGIYLNEKNGKLRIVRLENIARSYAQADITEQAGKITQRTELRLTGFTLRCKRAEDDALSKDDTFTVGEEEKVYNIELGALEEQISFDNILGVPCIVEGPYKAQKMSENFPFRIFYSTGNQSAGGFNYRGASINAMGWREKLDNGPFQLGVYETFWKYWLHFESRRRVVRLPVNFYFRQLRHFDWELKRVLDRNYFLVKNIRAKITMQGVQVSDVELYTMF